MKDVLCNLCGQDDYIVRYPATLDPREVNTPDARAFRCTSPDYGRHARIVQCKKCGFVYANPVWDETELIALYTGVEDDTYVTERIGRQLTFRRHLEALEKITGPGRGKTLLDVGAYIGVFVEVACAAGWDAVGVEPSEWAVAEARRRSLPVILGTLDAPALQERQFDAITIWDVIEHLPDPRAELEKAFARLKPGGIIAVHTMDIDSWMARLMGHRWPWFMTMHIQYFSQRTLARMLEMSGFEVVWTGPQGRTIRLTYLSSRLGGIFPPLGRAFDWLIHRLGIAEHAISINLGDLFTIYAKKVA